MIEMRWVKRKVPYEDGWEKVVKVLQYRYRHESMVGMTFLSDWSDWIDVPTVEEE